MAWSSAWKMFNGSKIAAYSRQYKRTNERKGTSYSTVAKGDQNFHTNSERVLLVQTFIMA
jgi:hypothetical protein